MRIKYITEDGLLAIKNNLNSVLKTVIINKEKTLTELFDEQGIIKETSFEIDEFSLDMSQPKGKEPLTDVENVMRIYNHMKFLSDSQASDERIWTALTLSEQLDYMRYRWLPENVDDVSNRFLFNYSSNRSLFRNGVSRLWWIARVSYDSTREDPYELTKYLCMHQDSILNICERTTFNNRTVQRATISAIYDADKQGMGIERQTWREISKYVNLLAGSYMIDMLSYDDLYEKISSKLDSIKGEQNAV